MDRELSPEELHRERLRKIALVAGPIVAAVLLLILLPGWLRPSLSRERIRTARVDRGPLEASITASGEVVPAFEKVLSSPVEARVLEVVRRPGALVEPGDEILRLDTTASRLDLERLEEQVAQKRNAQKQLRQELEKTLIDLRSRIETQRLDLEILRHREQQQRQLFAEGLISEEVLRQAEVEASKAAIVVRQLEESIASSRTATDTQLEGLELEVRIAERDRDEAARQLELATTRSDREGVVTWVQSEVGSTVRKGDVLARIADLGSFRVEATLSDVHAPRIAAGQTVKVLLDGEELPGRLSRVFPTIENGVMTFEAELNAPDDPRLRNDLRVDVLVVTESRGDVLRLRKGPFARGGGSAQEVFVAEGDRAVKRRVRLGVASYDHYEILDGLAEGEEVILSDLEDYLHLDSIRLK